MSTWPGWVTGVMESGYMNPPEAVGGAVGGTANLEDPREKSAKPEGAGDCSRTLGKKAELEEPGIGEKKGFPAGDSVGG